MSIGKLHDTIAVEGFGQVGRVYFHVIYVQFVGSEYPAVGKNVKANASQ